jgi:hypothetical protein
MLFPSSVTSAIFMVAILCVVCAGQPKLSQRGRDQTVVLALLLLHKAIKSEHWRQYAAPGRFCLGSNVGFGPGGVSGLTLDKIIYGKGVWQQNRFRSCMLNTLNRGGLYES